MSLDAGSMYVLLFISLYFEVFLLVTFLEKRFQSKKNTIKTNESALPSVAVIVPCFNEEGTVAATIGSLLQLRYPTHLLEIIAIDDGSTDETFRMLKQFKNTPRVRIFSKINGGKHTAMNYGLSKTNADLVASLDADSFVSPETLLRLVGVFNDTRVAAVTPSIHVKKPETLLQHIQQVEYRLSIFNRFIFATLGSAFITPGPFSIFRASVVKDIGGWRQGHFTEDMELALRIQAAGHLIANAPRATVHTVAPRTLRQLFRQRVRWTYGFLRNAVDYRHMFGDRTYGNLGIAVLPIAAISVLSAVYFFLRLTWHSVDSVIESITRYRLAGALPSFSFDLFYVNTSTLFFIIYSCIVLVLILIATGSWLATGSRKLPLATPLFVFLYCFIAPMWLGVAVVRAVFKTGVRWK